MNEPLTRRGFVIAVSVGAGGIATAWLGGCSSGAGAAEVLVDLSRELPPQVGALGQAYRRSHPEDAAGLTPEVVAREIWSGWVEPDAEALRAALLERIREDFRSDQVVRVRGWVLSQTEARLCALVPAPER